MQQESHTEEYQYAYIVYNNLAYKWHKMVHIYSINQEEGTFADIKILLNFSNVFTNDVNYRLSFSLKNTFIKISEKKLLFVFYSLIFNYNYVRFES
jgi:hypothetical protein